MLHNDLSRDASVGPVALDQLFPEATRTGTDQILATSCTSDWQQVQAGDVYVALPEMADPLRPEDGHTYARQAIERGAVAVVCEQPVPVFDVPTYLVPDSRIALGQLCQALVGNPTESMPVIAVSGTHGKSTTIALIESIFNRSGKICGKLSSLECYDGMSMSTGIGKTPSAPSLAQRLSRMEAAGCTHALLEVSSLSISQARLAGIQLDSVCVTHVTDAHLEWHNSIQTYRDTEHRVFENLSPGGVAILNADDPVSMEWIGSHDGPALTFGLGNQAEITAVILEQYANEQVFLLKAGSETATVRTSIVGQHHVENCMAAAALSLSYGISLQDIATGIEAVESLPERMQRVDCGQGYPVYVDSAKSPGALVATLRTARQLADKRVICVLGDEAYDHNASENLAITEIVKHMADVAIVAGVMTEMEMPALPSSNERAQVEVATNRQEAIAQAVSIAKPGDVVVITGCNSGPQLAFGDDASDAQYIKNLLFAQNDTIRLAA